MHIQQIEIDNFKSFSNKTIIPFEDGFTTISGPNGSGKSNIIDSILFCLGLSSSRTMRAEKLTDLINNLSKRRESSVSILFGEDNVTGNDEKVVVTRKIKDNGQAGYGSTYYLNGRVATLTEIHDRLGRHNISPGAYNVLMQGDVTGIINMSAMERRKIIDEIAGVAEFDRKIEQAQKELASVAGSIERFTILLGELEQRVTQLAEEREQALKYQALREEKLQYERMQQASRYQDLKRAYQAAEQNILEARKQKAKTQEALTDLEARIALNHEALTEITNAVKRKGEDQQIALKKQIEGLKGAVSRKTDSIRFGLEKQQEHQRQIARAEAEMERLATKIEDLTTTLEGYTHQAQEIQTRLEQEQANHDRLDTRYQKLLQSTGTRGDEVQQLRTSLYEAQDALSLAQRQHADHEAERERHQREYQYLTERAAASNSRFQELQASQVSLNSTLKEAALEKAAFEAQIQTQQQTVSETRVALNTLQQDLNRVHQAFARLDAQKRAYEDVHFGRSVETVLAAKLKGVHGTLAQLGRVTDPEFSTAVEIAMGARFKSIVVDNDRVAQTGVELLQQKKAGRATFLPLDKIREKQHLPLLPQDEGIVDYAVNLMAFEKRYQDVFGYALGDTVVVEDFDVARRHMRKFRMVTLDGALFEKTGAITGGSTPNAAGQGGKWASGNLDQELIVLREELETKDADRQRLEKTLSTAQIKLDTLKDDFAAWMAQTQRQQLALESLERELAQLQPAESADEAVAFVQEQMTTLEAQLKTLAQTIHAQEKTVNTLAEKLEKLDAQLPTQELEALKAEMADVDFQIRAYETQLRNNAAEQQSKRLEKEFQEKGIANYTDQIEQLKTHNLAIDAENVQFQEEIGLIEQQITALEAQTGQLDEELQRLQGERETVQARLIAEEQEKYGLTRELTLLDEQVLSYQARKRELQPELNALHEELGAAGFTQEDLEKTDLPTLEEILKNIQRLEKKMDAMGAVNMRAIEDYDAVMSRHQELTDKIDTLNREKTDLGGKITGYNALKLQAFMTAFDNVNTNFQEIFQELSDGEGHLVLTNPADPFSGGLTIEARPRDKKMQRLEAMSGGEKSLTALAFVFSFQRYMPAPFYAFDEVDMFLDGINAEKLAQMVKKQSSTAQFIVVSLRKPMLASSDRTVGVTQKRDGISKVTGVVLKHAC